MIHYLPYCALGILLLCSKLRAQIDNQAIAEKLNTMQWNDFIEAPLDSLLSSINLPFTPYHIHPEFLTNLLHFSVLFPYTDTHFLQVQITLQPRFFHRDKLHHWDALSTTQWTICAIDTSLTNKYDQQTIKDTYCFDLLLYLYNYHAPNEPPRQIYLPGYSNWHTIDPPLQEQFRLGCEQLMGQSK